jgi:hypothetical protein
MKLLELFESSRSQLTLKIDNPGGDWLANKIADTKAGGKRPSGRYNILGSTTAWFNREAFIPTEILASIKGTNQEQQNVRKDSLDFLISYMKTHKKLPDADWHEHNEYAPFIVVDQDGVPYVNEGNHRIMAAKAAGFKGLPVEIKYFNGGEQQYGPLSPQSVITYDNNLRTAGIWYGNYV